MEVHYQAVVFREAPPTPDFSCSERITLPGRHGADGARSVLYEALRRDASLVGGEVVQVFAEIDAERDAETLLISERRS